MLRHTCSADDIQYTAVPWYLELYLAITPSSSMHFQSGAHTLDTESTAAAVARCCLLALLQGGKTFLSDLEFKSACAQGLLPRNTILASQCYKVQKYPSYVRRCS